MTTASPIASLLGAFHGASVRRRGRVSSTASSWSLRGCRPQLAAVIIVLRLRPRTSGDTVRANWSRTFLLGVVCFAHFTPSILIFVQIIQCTATRWWRRPCCFVELAFRGIVSLDPMATAHAFAANIACLRSANVDSPRSLGCATSRFRRRRRC